MSESLDRLKTMIIVVNRSLSRAERRAFRDLLKRAAELTETQSWGNKDQARVAREVASAVRSD
jgi:hypothetical protein